MAALRIFAEFFGLTSIMSETFELRIELVNVHEHHVCGITIQRLNNSQLREAYRSHPTNLKQTDYIHHKIQFGSVICIPPPFYDSTASIR